MAPARSEFPVWSRGPIQSPRRPDVDPLCGGRSGNQYPAGHLSSRRDEVQVARKDIKMISWFISPWEAVRLSLEVQRVMAFHFLRFASGQERPLQEVLSDGGEALVPRLVDQSLVASAEPAIPSRSMATRGPKTVPVRKAMGVIRKPISASKVKDKRTKRKDKSRRK
jgi:hypothetical protein